jgi:hypothetical protein
MTMDQETKKRTSWVAPVYGYTVCLVAVITFLIAAGSFVDAVFQRSAPLQQADRYTTDGGSLTSFEAFRATYTARYRSRAPGDTVKNRDTLTTAELRERYEALRTDVIERESYRGTKQLVRSGLLVLVAIALFATHWTWLRRRDNTAAS